MANPGLQVVVQDGNLGIQPGGNTNVMLLMGESLGGVVGTMYSFGDPVTAANTLLGGELLEAVVALLKAANGSVVMAMPLPPTTRGGVGPVTHTGPGVMTVTPSIAPHGTITITCTTGGTIGTAAFTFGITNPITGVTTTSAPVTSVGGWTSTGYRPVGTYVMIVFTAGTYISGGSADIYTIPVAGVIAHPQGAGPAVPTFTASPVDFYNVLVTVTLGGAVGTSQITYSLDNGNSTSSVLTSAASYAIPNTGIVLALSGTATALDTYAFSCAGPTFSNTDLTTNLTTIETTLLAQQTESLVGVVGSVASAAAWATQVSTLESAAVTLAGTNIYVRFFCGGPTVGTVLQNAGSITVDSADTDSTVIAARAGMSAPHVCVGAGDGMYVSPYSGLQLRRSGIWAAMQRALANPASQDIGAFADGGLVGWTSCVRDDFANGMSFYAAGITSLRTWGPGPVFINRGLMGTVSTSDYYPLTNARVIDRASAIGALNLKPYVLAKLPTMTRNGVAGTIREDAAVKIEGKLATALQQGLVYGSPQDAVGASAVVTRTNNLYSTQQLIVTGAVQPFGYPTAVIFNVGMTLQAS
jgi:hypothetical protein